MQQNILKMNKTFTSIYSRAVTHFTPFKFVFSMSHQVKVIEQCGVSPPPGSVPSTTLPLTSFDIPTALSVPVEMLFFYEFPHSTNQFMKTVLPSLKHSLSLTLQHFFPLAGCFVFPHSVSHTPSILYSQGDSLSFTVKEYAQDFHHVIADTPKDVRVLHPFVPMMPSSRDSNDDTRLFPLAAVQVTILPNSGFSICLIFNHVVADGRAIVHFIKFWSCVCRKKGELASLEGSLSLPLHNRDTIADPKGAKLINLQHLSKLSSENTKLFDHSIRDDHSDKIRVTCVLRRDCLEKLKNWVATQGKSYGLEPGSLHVSTFAVTCSLVWICMVKSQEENANVVSNDDEIYNWTFLAECRNHPEVSISSNYFGNCLVRRNASLKRSKLVGESGIVEAVLAIDGQVRDSQHEPLKGFEKLLSDHMEIVKSGQHVVTVAGTTKLDAYDIDFGWGKPKKFEFPHIEKSGSISLNECRDNDGGVEIGIVLGKNQMNSFNTIFKKYLKNINYQPSKL